MTSHILWKSFARPMKRIIRQGLFIPCVITLLVGTPVNATETCPGTNSDWKQHSDLVHGFVIQYPSITHVQVAQENVPGLLSHTVFAFDPFPLGEDGGSIEFSFQILVWQNPEKLTAEAWARQQTNPQFTSPVRSHPIADHKGIMVRTSNLVWYTDHIFVDEADRMYEVNYTDINQFPKTSDVVRSCWTSTFDKMVDSFKLTYQTR
jgi:hypothetical protein